MTPTLHPVLREACREGGGLPARSWRVRAWIRISAVVAFCGVALEQADVVRRVAAGQMPASEARDGYAVLVVMALLVWLLAFRPVFTLTSDGEVQVRNPLTSYRLRAEDVVDVTMNPWGLLLHLSDGTRRWSIIFQDTASFGEPQWFDVAEVLTGRRPEMEANLDHD